MGLEKYKGAWLSHAPIHPAELRGKINIHGHVHYANVLDETGKLDNRYFNVSLENTGGCPIALNVIKEILGVNRHA